MGRERSCPTRHPSERHRQPARPDSERACDAGLGGGSASGGHAVIEACPSGTAFKPTIHSAAGATQSPFWPFLPAAHPASGPCSTSPLMVDPAQHNPGPRS